MALGGPLRLPWYWPVHFWGSNHFEPQAFDTWDTSILPRKKLLHGRAQTKRWEVLLKLGSCSITNFVAWRGVRLRSESSIVKMNFLVSQGMKYHLQAWINKPSWPQIPLKNVFPIVSTPMYPPHVSCSKKRQKHKERKNSRIFHNGCNSRSLYSTEFSTS